MSQRSQKQKQPQDDAVAEVNNYAVAIQNTNKLRTKLELSAIHAEEKEFTAAVRHAQDFLQREVEAGRIEKRDYDGEAQYLRARFQSQIQELMHVYINVILRELGGRKSKYPAIKTAIAELPIYKEEARYILEDLNELYTRYLDTRKAVEDFARLEPLERALTVNGVINCDAIQSLDLALLHLRTCSSFPVRDTRRSFELACGDVSSHQEDLCKKSSLSQVANSLDQETARCLKDFSSVNIEWQDWAARKKLSDDYGGLEDSLEHVHQTIQQLRARSMPTTLDRLTHVAEGILSVRSNLVRISSQLDQLRNARKPSRSPNRLVEGLRTAAALEVFRPKSRASTRSLSNSPGPDGRLQE